MYVIATPCKFLVDASIDYNFNKMWFCWRSCCWSLLFIIPYAFVVFITPQSQIYCSFPNWFITALIFKLCICCYQPNWRRAQNLSGHLSRPYFVSMCSLFYALCVVYLLISLRSSGSLQLWVNLEKNNKFGFGG